MQIVTWKFDLAGHQEVGRERVHFSEGKEGGADDQSGWDGDDSGDPSDPSLGDDLLRESQVFDAQDSDDAKTAWGKESSHHVNMSTEPNNSKH